MNQAERPLSPHIQIYRWHFTMFLSIVHRATGVALAGGAFLMAWWLLSAASGAESFEQFQSFAHSIVGQIMIFGWLWSLCFHFLNGIRHLVWDAGQWLDLKSAYASGYAVFGLSFLSAAAIWFSVG